MFKLFAPKRRWRVHICATTPDQRTYLDALTDWLRRDGHTILAAPAAPLGARIAAARACEVCLLILGPEYGTREPHASFSATELETYAALEDGGSKLLIFSQPDTDSANSAEQREFIARLRDFTGGTFQATIAAPDLLPGELAAALARMAAAEDARRDLSRAVMISSTGDLVPERTRLRELLTRLRHPVIDYQTAASETATPIERVTAWAGECRALLLILGRRYGFVSPVDGLGATELEFVTALSAGRPVLALIRPDALTTDDPDQRQFIERVRHFLPPERIRDCPTLDDLEREARAGLGALLGGSKPAPLSAVPEERARVWYQRQIERWLGTLPHARNPAGMALATMPLLLVEEPIAIAPLLDLAEAGMAHLAPESLAGVAAITPDDALAQEERLIIAGEPGAGKSVILRWYALGAARLGARVPILVTLPDYARARRAGDCETLLDYIEREERRMLLAAPDDPSRWRAALTSGRGLLLLDDLSGLEGGERAAVAAEIGACAAALPRETAIVVTQRDEPATSLDGFTPRYILPLLQAQLEEITQQWVEAARQVEELNDKQARALFLTIVFQARGLSDYTTWARTPLLLTALITVLDSSDLRMLRMLAGSGSTLMRRALRIILAQARRPRQLWEKERLLLEVARQTRDEPPRKALPAAALQSAWAAVAPNALDGSAEAILRDLTPLLTAQQGAWSYLHEVFSAVYTASALAAEPADRRNDQIARRRLYTDWNTVPALLAGELDRLGRPAEGDAVAGALLAGDAAVVADSGHPDPFNIALATAVVAQGARATEYARAGHGPEIARLLGAILREQLKEPAESRYAINGTTWLLLLLGPAAAEVLDDLTPAMGEPLGYALLTLRSLAVGGDERARALVEAYDAAHPSGRIATFASVATLIEWLREDMRSPDEQTRREAAMNISTYGPRAAPAIPELRTLLASDDWMARKYATRTLAGIGPASAGALTKLLDLALHDPVTQVEYAARAAMTRIQGAATPEMAQAIAPELRGGDYRTAQRVARTLAALGPVAAPCAPDLIWLGIEGADGLATLDAGAAIVALGPDAVAAAITAIAGAIQGDDWRAQRQALDMAGAMRASAAPLYGLLRACISDPGYLSRSEAIMVFGFLGEAALPALPDLRALLADPAARGATLVALPRLGELARPLLADVLALRDDPDPNIRYHVYDTLKAMEIAITPEIAAILLRGMDDEDVNARNQAIFTASYLRPVTPEIAAALLRRYYATLGQPEAWAMRFNLQRLLKDLWDAGALAG